MREVQHETATDIYSYINGAPLSEKRDDREATEEVIYVLFHFSD